MKKQLSFTVIAMALCAFFATAQARAEVTFNPDPGDNAYSSPLYVTIVPSASGNGIRWNRMPALIPQRRYNAPLQITINGPLCAAEYDKATGQMVGGVKCKVYHVEGVRTYAKKPAPAPATKAYSPTMKWSDDGMSANQTLDAIQCTPDGKGGKNCTDQNIDIVEDMGVLNTNIGAVAEGLKKHKKSIHPIFVPGSEPGSANSAVPKRRCKEWVTDAQTGETTCKIYETSYEEVVTAPTLLAAHKEAMERAETLWCNQEWWKGLICYGGAAAIIGGSLGIAAATGAFNGGGDYISVP